MIFQLPELLASVTTLDMSPPVTDCQLSSYTHIDMFLPTVLSPDLRVLDQV